MTHITKAQVACKMDEATRRFGELNEQLKKATRCQETAILEQMEKAARDHMTWQAVYNNLR